MIRTFKILSLVIFVLISGCKNHKTTDRPDGNAPPDRIYAYQEGMEPRWSSFENLNGIKGNGGMENNGAKGHPSDMIRSGEHKVLLNTQGPGMINRIWLTIRNRSPHALRGLIFNMYWDGEEKPAVSVPLGDFFGVGLGKTAVFENDLFANPEGRSFNSYVQMPFRQAVKIEIFNDMDYDIFLVFFDVNYQLLDKWDPDYLYFHAYWHRDTATVPGVDFNILPEIHGKGRFLGTNVSVAANPAYKDYWWGEGEVKVYLNGDDPHPTLVGTGTEDYIGTAWGQGPFHDRYNGCLIADPEHNQWAFYRYHILDPIYFQTDCRVSIQQMGGTSKSNVIDLLKHGVNLIPVTINGADSRLIHIYHPDSTVDLENPALPGEDAWTNFYRSDDISAVAYFYLDRPANELPAIQDLEVRTWNLND
jgi:hypothetical protein